MIGDVGGIDRIEQSADLGGDDAVGRVVEATEKGPEPGFGASEPVEGSGIEEADAGIMGRLERGLRVAVRAGLVEAADRRRAERDAGDGKLRARQPA